MRSAVIVLLSAALCLSSAAETAKLSADLKTLTTSRDGERLEAAAIEVASSNDAQAIARLEKLLGSRAFLAYLDDLKNPQQQVLHLSRVLLALQENPSSITENLLVNLAGNLSFIEIPARLNYLLPVLAMRKPMTTRAAEVFRRTDHDGFFSINGPLLVNNGSPRALDVFGSIVGDHNIDVASRIDVLRRSVVPNRTSEALLRCIAHLLDTQMEPQIHIALLESVFEYKPQWFGRIASLPAPPSWETASAEARSAAIAVGQKGLRRTDLPASLRMAIADTTNRLTVIARK